MTEPALIKPAYASELFCSGTRESYFNEIKVTGLVLFQSMTSAFGAPDYYRVRLGIGRPMAEQDPADFVLKAFSKVEQKDLSEFIVRGADVVESLINEGLERTQTRFNS